MYVCGWYTSQIYLLSLSLCINVITSLKLSSLPGNDIFDLMRLNIYMELRWWLFFNKVWKILIFIVAMLLLAEYKIKYIILSFFPQIFCSHHYMNFEWVLCNFFIMCITPQCSFPCVLWMIQVTCFVGL